MSEYSRFAVYYLPEPGHLADFGAKWLGWDAQSGLDRSPFDVPDWDTVTRTPRKYGFHGTLKPPFRLAAGQDLHSLDSAMHDLASRVAPAQATSLALTRLGRFLALTPVGDGSDIARVAAACVRDLDSFRAPPSPAELERRRSVGLTPEQDAHLVRWGYPYVLDQFRFHLTLTGRLDGDLLARTQDLLKRIFPPLPKPFQLNSVCLLGERPDGQFELVHRYPLVG